MSTPNVYLHFVMQCLNNYPITLIHPVFETQINNSVTKP